MKYFIKTPFILILFFCVGAFCRDDFRSEKTEISIFSTNHSDFSSLSLEQSDGEQIDLNDFSIIETPEITLNKLNEYDLFSIFIENKKYNIVPQIRKLYGNEFFSISGYYESIGKGTEYFAVFTFSNEGLIGDFYLPEGHYQADVKNNINILLNPEYLEGKISLNAFDLDQDYSNYTNDDYIKVVPNDSESNSEVKNIVGLGVGFIFANGIANNSTSQAHMINAINFANNQYMSSGVNIRLSLRLFSSAKTSLTSGVANDIFVLNELLKNETVNLIDPNGAIVIGTKQIPTDINQLVLVIGPSNINSSVCGVAGTPRAVGMTSTYRLSSNCLNNTLVHEIGHNLTLVHEDGAFKDFNPNSSEQTKSWKSIMRSSGQGARYFTGGDKGNVYDLDFCGGFCNTEPYSDHNSILRMNKYRNAADNNYFLYYGSAQIDPGPTNNY